MANESDAIIQTDVLIIGAGLAGLSTALSLPKSLRITVLSKAALEVCSSHYAQGGIAASLDKSDSVADHVADTLVAGAGLCTADNTASILGAGQQAVQWLCTQGVPFTQTSKDIDAAPLAELKTTDLHLTKEGGHGCRRVAHADDATGQHVMAALIANAKAAANITILPHHEALSLLTKTPKSHAVSQVAKHKKCHGAVVFDHSKHGQLTIRSHATVLASGGLGQLFKRASAPNVCVGDGVMMAWQAGCRLANLEFIQFHPTGLALNDSSFLISEALRGEGGHLYCPKTGQRFMPDIDTRAELAPRDIVARAIAEQIDNNGLGYVHLDVSHLPATFIQAHFPQIYQTLLTLGIDITTDPIPVAPTAHYSCGGVVTDANGVTDVAGLYAAGEVAYTGLHGANRLASNSLLECVVVGRNIAADLPRYLTALESLDNHYDRYNDDNSNLSASTIWTAPIVKGIQTIDLPSTSSYSSSTDLHDEADTDIAQIPLDLKALMTSHLGITRHAESLAHALIQIQQWQHSLAQAKSTQYDNSNETLSPDAPSRHALNADTLGLNALNSDALNLNTLTHFQLARQLQLATLIVQSAYQRLESRGGHYRIDYPDLNATPRISVIAPLRPNKPIRKPAPHQPKSTIRFATKPQLETITAS